MRRTIHGSRFDSILDLDSVREGNHANLTLHMKVSLQQFAPPDGQDTLRYLQSDAQTSSHIVIGQWLPADDWGGWCRQFENDAEAFFHGKLWLVPSHPVVLGSLAPGQSSPYCSGIRCGFRISRVPISECHFIVDVAKLASMSEPFRSYQIQRSGLSEVRGTNREFLGLDDANPENLSSYYRACFAGTGRLMLTDGDLDVTQRSNFSSSYSQRPFLHELGHAIGLGHVNGAGNSELAYGSTAHQYGDLMGGGERIEPWHAFPWKRRLDRHFLGSRAFGESFWSATTRRPPVDDRTYVYPEPSPISSPGGVVSLDGGVASRCGVRGCSQRGP